MWISIGLASVPLVLGLVLAWVVWRWAERLAGWSVRKVRTVAASMAIGGLVFAVYAFAVDWDLRRTTLFEVLIEIEEEDPGQGAGTVRSYEFNVESPGVEHDITYAPKPRPLHYASGDVRIRIEILDAIGERVHTDETLFEPRLAGGHRPASAHHEWSGRSTAFTPRSTGPHTLRVLPLTRGIPRIQVRIGDPEKRDGGRIPGY